MVLADLSKRLTESVKKFGARNSAQAEAEVDNLLDDIGTALIDGDVSVPYVNELKKEVRKEILDERSIRASYGVQGGFTKLGSQQKQRVIQRAVVTHLGKLLKGDGSPYQPKKRTEKRRGDKTANEPEVVLFVGLQGAGKTTSITKYAHFYKQKGFRVALVCADTFRAGAFDQLKQNASKIHTPFFGSYTETDPVAIAEDGVHAFKSDTQEQFDLILVDSSGRHKQEAALFDEMSQLVEAIQPTASILVMDSRIGQAGFRQASAFAESVDIGSVILTKMDDGSQKGGGALAAVAATGAPVVFLGTGEHFDELEQFRAEGFVSKLLGLGDFTGFFENVTDRFIDTDALKRLADMEMNDGKSPTHADFSNVLKGEHKNLFDNISKGKFSLRNLYEMFNSIGPMGNMMNMIPGFGGGGMPAMPGMPPIDKEASTKRMQKCITIMNSMTNIELDGVHPKTGQVIDVTKDESRIRRIARGSGCKSEADVKLLFSEYDRIKDMVDKIGEFDFSNPFATMQKMKAAMDPTQRQAMKSMMGNMGGFVENMMAGMGLGKPPPGMVDQVMNGFLSDDPNANPMASMLGGGQGNPMLAGGATSSTDDGNTTLITGSNGGQKRVLKNEVPVVLQGLKSRPGENGKTGKILGYDESKGRYMVGDIEGVDQPLALKPTNLLQKDAAVKDSSGIMDKLKLDWKSILFGKGGNSPPPDGMVSDLSKHVKNPSGIADKPIQLLDKTTVRVQGLQSEKGKIWNDCYGVIMGFDEASERYVVNVGPTELKIKLQNIML